MPVGRASSVGAGTLSGAGAAASGVPASTGPVVAGVAEPHQLPAASAVPAPLLESETSEEPATEKARTAGFDGSGPSSASVSVKGPESSEPEIVPRCPYAYVTGPATREPKRLPYGVTPERTVVVAVPSAPRASSKKTPPALTTLFSSVTWRRTPASAPCSELVMISP